jgi:hypothetical protein
MSTTLRTPGMLRWQPTSVEQARAPMTWREKISLSTEVLAAYTSARWLLRRRPLPEAILLLRSHAGRPPSGVSTDSAQRNPADLVVARRIGRVVTRILRILPTDGRCLVRSVTLAALLEKRAIDCGVVIGAQADSNFAAHAWVEVGDHPVLETNVSVFRPLWRG